MAADKTESDLKDTSEGGPGEESDHVPEAGDAAALLDLLPVPAALVAIKGGRLAFEAVNGPFRLAGLGATAAESQLVRLLGMQLRRFLENEAAVQQEVAWQFGEEVDARYFRVTFARRPASRHVPRCLVTLVDQTSELRTEHSLRREMLTDSLTGLPNRGGFSDQLEALVTPENRASFAVLAIDLTRFSRVNACAGSLAGDELLISVARRVKGALRSRDLLARTGGDEFAVLMALDEGGEDALHVAKRIQAALAAPFRLSSFEIRIDCSIGVALGAEEHEEPEDLIRHAQFAVRKAKESGRTEVYQSSAFNIVREQFGIETELRRAIEEARLTLHFQPICDLARGAIRSFEALARWTTEAGVKLSPDVFIPVAEESGLIVPLGRWAMDEAARTLAEWDRAAGGDCGVNIAVNLSAIQLQRDQVAAMVGDALDRHRVDGHRFILELTESAIVSDPDRVSRSMMALKELGATLAMDDFGTGYSNLAYLQKLPIDLLKIDRSFVTDMLEDRDKLAIVRAILSLADALGMQTTAEGIESEALARELAALGCSYGQGFLYARPLEKNAAYALLSEMTSSAS